MNCPYCNTPSDPSNPFCRNCGQPLVQQQHYAYPPQGFAAVPAEKDKSINYLMILLGWGLFSGILWTFIGRFMSSYLRDHAVEDYSKFYQLISLGFFVVTLGLLITFMILSKNKNVRTFLIVYTIADVLLHLYSIFEYMLR